MNKKEQKAQEEKAQENVTSEQENFGAEREPQVNEPNEQKDARGGNHNPKGANQYTSGRVDDRGRKE